MPTTAYHKIANDQPKVSGIRELSRADLIHLTKPRDPTRIKSIADSHHRVARAIASGMSNGEVAAVCGRSITRVSQLRGDPAFQELIAHYRSMITAEWLGNADPVIDFMRNNALKAQAMLSDKLDAAAESDEFLPTRDLVSIAELGLDRTGYGKVNKNVNINVDFAANLEKARKRSDRARTISPTQAPTIEASPSRLPPQSASVSAPVQTSPAPRPPAFRRV